MTEQELQAIRDQIAKSIRVEVNGKIDKLQKGMDEHIIVCIPAIENHDKVMNRITPVLEAFENAQQDLAVAKKGGKLILWLAATITAIGGSYLVLRAIFFNH